MPQQGTYFTPEGIEVKLAKYWHDPDRRKTSGKLNTLGAFEKMEFDVDLRDLQDGAPNFDVDRDGDGTADGFSSNNGLIPANASIVSATVTTREAAVGGTSFDVGLFQFDGTAVDATGLATVALADVDAVGKRFVGAGANTVPATAGVGPTDVTLGITGSGVFTAGKVRIIVEYVINQY